MDERGDAREAAREPNKRRNEERTQDMKTLTKRALILTAVLLCAAMAQAADGKAVWEKSCAKCHGKEGKGDTKMGQKLGAKDYTDAKVQAELKDEAAIKAVKEGLKDKDGKVLMKPAEDLTDADIKAVVGYLRTLKK